MSMVSAALSRPYPDRPAEGVVNFYVEYSSMAVPSESDPSEKQTRLQRLIERVFKSSRLVDTESLCILPGEQVWAIRVETHVLDDDGNVTDAAIAAVLAALLSFRRLDSAVVNDNVVIVRIHPS